MTFLVYTVSFTWLECAAVSFNNGNKYFFNESSVVTNAFTNKNQSAFFWSETKAPKKHWHAPTLVTEI